MCEHIPGYDAWKTATPWDGLEECPECGEWLDEEGWCEACAKRDEEEAEERNDDALPAV